jgi:hypothetical protein
MGNRQFFTLSTKYLKNCNSDLLQTSLRPSKKKNWFSGHVFENQMRGAGFLFLFIFYFYQDHLRIDLGPPRTIKTSLLSIYQWEQ